MSSRTEPSAEGKLLRISYHFSVAERGFHPPCQVLQRSNQSRIHNNRGCWKGVQSAPKPVNASGIFMLRQFSNCSAGEVNMTKANGLVEVESRHSVEETVRKLRAIFAEKGLEIFAVIDHSGEAEKVGLKMPSTKVVIFGSPKAGTPLMITAPSLAIDLPLKALVAADTKGQVSVRYNDPEYLRERHGVPAELMKNLAGAGVLIAQAVE